jgi:cytochrome P450
VSTAPGKVGAGDQYSDSADLNLLGWADRKFESYITDRRAEPKGDVLTELALATYPDGSLPDVVNVVRTATFLFAAGQETSARMLAAALKYLAEDPALQDELRAHKDKIPAFIEETLRLEAPVKADFRLARRTTEIGGVEIKAGTPVMMLNGAANRDPRQFNCPHDFNLEREGLRTHIAFGRGNHSCPGGPLARAEGVVAIDRILERMHDIRLSEEHHGAPGARHFDYEPTWVLRGLSNLHIEWTPVESSR